uniref:Fzd-4-3 n=1 Tax=Schmidtea mediterranea TaxID=79327 RepID=T1DBJ6_SCHMD|nr:hypothetical protein Smed-fzd-4-3 [Schmidtea mediterranea]
MIKLPPVNICLFLLISIVDSIENEKCKPKPIAIGQCQNKFYNFTSLSQDQEAEVQIPIETYRSLLSNGCSKHLNFLLCSVYVPFCDYDTGIQLEPCRKVCEKVQFDCEPILKLVNLSWPEKLNCSRFPLESSHQMQCMHPSQEENLQRKIQIQNLSLNKDRNNIHEPKQYRGQCRHMRNGEKYVFINRTGRCALKCSENDFFSKESKTIAEIWMKVITSLTFVSTLFTCVTFCHNRRIRYPEQPIIFLTFSYNIYSISILLRLFLGREKVSCDFDPVSGQKILIQEGLENTNCAITFLLNFFFSTATHMWWIMLCLCWTLFCALNVSALSLAKNSGIFHLFVWLMTSVLTVSVLILRSVDADELFGLCSVGEQTPDLLLTFSIIPQLICLIIGFIFLLSGFFFFKYRTKKFSNKSLCHHQKITFLLSIGFRLGLFSIIYIIAIATMICCELYQYYNYHYWSRAPIKFSKRKDAIVAVFLLKFFMNQVVGINSAIWILSLDSVAAWKKCFVMLLEKVTFNKKIKSNSREIESYGQLNSTNSNKYWLYCKSGN